MTDALQEILNRAKPTVNRKQELLVDRRSIAVPEPEPEPEIVQRALRVHKSIADLLKDLCDRGKIKPDVLIEAALLEISKNPELLDRIVAEARIRLEKRKRLGYARKAQTMIRRSIAVPEPEPEPEIVQRALRVHKSIADLLKDLCDRGKIKPDVLIEAALLEISKNPELLDRIVTEARIRLEKRKRLGYARKAQTMIKNLEKD